MFIRIVSAIMTVLLLISLHEYLHYKRGEKSVFDVLNGLDEPCPVEEPSTSRHPRF